MPFAESHGRRIYYERHGQGPAVLFCHGAGSNAATWWQQLPAFRAQHTCITMDIRCFGRSGAPVEEFAMRLFVDDLIAVLDREQVERVVVVGQSLGGMIGLRVALQHAHRVAAFAACDTTLAIEHSVLIDLLRRRQVTHRAVNIEERSLGKWFLQNEPQKAALYAQINHFNPSFHSISAQQWGEAMGGLMHPSHLLPMQSLTKVGCPTLLLVGSEDPLVPVEVMREVAELIPQSELLVVGEAGHSAYFEKPAEFNRGVLDFIARRALYDDPHRLV